MQIFIDLFMRVLNSLNELTGNYGLALICFAFLIKVALYGPQQQQYKSMKEMQKVQPEIEELKKKHGDNQEVFLKAQAELFNEKGINPISGCLPLLIQMPILFSIWRAIMGSPELFSNSYFLWVHPGPLQSAYPALFASSLADRDLPLILFYGLTMMLSTLLTPTQGSGNQRYIGVFMSVFFTIMMWFYKWPCALLLYWSVFTFLTIIQQGMIMRSDDPAEPEAPPAEAPKKE